MTRTLLSLLLAAAVAAPLEPSAPDYEVERVQDWLTMPDGVRLSVTYFMPKGPPARFPVLLELLPYRKDDAFLARDYPLHAYFARRGYVSAKVDVRGTGSSEGAVPDREYSDAEIDDAVEIISQLAAKPWSNGNVGMWGISWGGFNALISATRQPPALKAVLAADASDDLFHDDVRYIDGVLHLDEYALAIDHDNGLPRSPDYPLDASYFRDRFERKPWLFTYLAQQQDGPFWREKSLRFHCGSVRTPVYLIGGLLDSYRDSVPRLLECLSSPVKAEIGPWGHAWPDNGEPGPNYEWRRQAVRWWDHWLKKRDTGVLSEPRFVVFARDAHAPDMSLKRLPGRWRELPWPPEPGLRTVLYPSPGGRLAGSAPASGKDSLVYKPQAGFEVGYYWGELTGDMRPLDADSLVYESAPLDRGIEIAGFPRVALDAASSGLARWVARLEDVFPDGSVALVTGAAIGRGEHPLRFTTWRFEPGHRVRLALTNSLFPMLWPLPGAGTSALSLGKGTRLQLPIAPPSGDMPILPAPEPREKHPAAEDLGSRGWPYASTRSTDAAVCWRGENLYRVPGASVTATQEMTYRVPGDDPSRASWTGSARTLLSLDGGRELELRTDAELRSDARDFRLRVTRRIRQAGRLVREKTWDETVPRRR